MIYNTTTNVINCYDGTSWGTLEEYLDLTNNQTLESGVKTFSNDIYPTGKILMPMAEINYFDSDTDIGGTTIVIPNQYSTDADLVPINVVSSLNSFYEFDNGGADDGSLRYIGETMKIFHIAATISGNKAGGNNNEIYLFALAKNGVVQNTGRVIGDMTGVQTTAFHVMLMLNKNDTLRFYVGNTSGTEDFICYSLNLFAWGM